MTDFTIPVPSCWEGTTLTDTQRAALEATAALADGTSGNIDQAANAAKYVLDQAANTAELVLLATRMEEVHGADLGYTVSFPGIVDDDAAPATDNRLGAPRPRRIRINATVLPDLILDQQQVPPAYLATALMADPRPAVLIGRITMVDDAAETITVELFSKTDQYEVTVPNSIVLDETLLGRAATEHRRWLYRVLSREFGGE